MRVWAVAACAALLSACFFDEGGIDFGGGGDASVVDAGGGDGGQAVDADVNANDAAACQDWSWDPTNVSPCDPALQPATQGLALSGLTTYVFDTDTGELSGPSGPSSPPSAVVAQAGAPELRVVVLTGLSVDVLTTLRIQGSRAVLFLVWGDATIDGTIDLSSQLVGLANDRVAGPGADDAVACSSGKGAPGKSATDDAGGAGGGGGAGFGDDGGNGGDGNGPGHGGKGGKGSKLGSTTLSPLRGGCPGGIGGDANNAGAGKGGVGGKGGGAIEIAARDHLTVSGSIIAAGTGGRPGGADLAGGHAGGGGGGTGGAILLESDMLSINDPARLCANGGSGGEGAEAVIGGADGQTGNCAEDSGATTIDLLGNGGNGGSGGYRGGPAGGNATNGGMGGGGGGGGGGVGIIRLRGVSSESVANNATVSPQEQ